MDNPDSTTSLLWHPNASTTYPTDVHARASPYHLEEESVLKDPVGTTQAHHRFLPSTTARTEASLDSVPQYTAAHESQHATHPMLPQDSNETPDAHFLTTNAVQLTSPRLKAWKPLTLRVPLLLSTLGITLVLIVVIWWMLRTSNENQGLMFASDIDDLSWWKSFSYRYLSTLLAVLYSFLWCWIDLDVRRLEPYFQTSRPEGAAADDSVLLDYPFQFVATVPIKAARRGHWSVFASATAFILVTFLLTPFQAGLFAVHTVVLSESVKSSHATTYTPTDQQKDLNAISAQYAYNVAWLNESLRAFTTRDYVLAPFGPDNGASTATASLSTFTGPTLMYSVDVECEQPKPTTCSLIPGETYPCIGSTHGCSYSIQDNPTTNDTSKIFRTMYVAHCPVGWSQADYYLSESCHDRFWVTWIKRSPEAFTAEGGASTNTTLFCNPTYFQQEVEATITLPDQRVFHVEPKGEKQDLPRDLFNSSLFEWSTASGTVEVASPDYPETSFPEQKTRLQDMPIDMDYLPEMAPFAIAAYPMPLDAYLDPEVLGLSYQAAYRLLFTQQLAQILHSQRNSDTEQLGQRLYETEAVYVVGVFAYVVIGILGSIAFMCCCLLFLTWRRHTCLVRDPGSIKALMELVRFDGDLIALFTRLARLDLKSWKAQLRSRGFVLRRTLPNVDAAQLRLLKSPASYSHSIGSTIDETTSSKASLVERKVRPLILRFMSGVTLLVLQTLALAALVGLYTYSRLHNGVPLPGDSRIARQLVENYIPLGAATLLEAAWLLLNRLVCLLQPWEEFRRGNARPSRSLNLNYGSLPPQLGLFRALKARHMKLAAVCLMTLLANVLAIALSGVMVEDSVLTDKEAPFHQLYTTTMKTLPGIEIPFNSDRAPNSQGGSTFDPFYQVMSNLTANTQLPPWADDDWAYLPLKLPEDTHASSYRTTTPAFGVNLICKPVDSTLLTYTMDMPNSTSTYGFFNLTVPISAGNGSTINCKEAPLKPLIHLDWVPPPVAGRNALMFGTPLSADDASDNLACQQHFAMAWLRADVRNLTTGAVGADIPIAITSLNKTVIACTAEPLQATANVLVGADGRVQRHTDHGLHDPKKQSPINEIFLSQANNFLVDGKCIWQTETVPSGFLQYLMAKANQSTAATMEPDSPVPAFSEVAPTVERLYRKLYAVLVAQNFDLLFEPATEDIKATAITGFTYSTETRIFILLPAFVVSVSILSLYILVTIWLYLQRPWNNLPRLPTTIASVITYFAASNAMRQIALQGGGETDEAERENWRWGYGSFVGPDGKLHVGIESEKWLSSDGKDFEMVSLVEPSTVERP